LNELDKKYTILDILSESDWKSKHICAGIKIPLNELPEPLTKISQDQTLIAHCQAGYRSVIVPCLLENRDRKMCLIRSKAIKPGFRRSPHNLMNDQNIVA
tara:strand:+ start:10901 stop:11200 length:300 start_codon:yes stop_codon:yes gene_type:complete